MEFHQSWSLLLVALGAAFLPGLSRMVRLPAVVMEILFGVLLGKSLLNLEFSGDWMVFLAQLGFLLLMFQAGMEIDFTALRRQPKHRILLQFVFFGATFGLSLVAALWLGQGVFMALILSTTSLGLVVPTLKETGISQKPLGQSALMAATLADFLTLFGITFYVLWHEVGLSWQFLSPLPLFFGFGLLLKALRLWSWWYPEKAGRLLASRDTQELGVRFSLALLFLFVALSELVHLEPVLGAFMGGTLLSIVFREKGPLETKLSGIGSGFLIPVFFINVGMQFDVTNVGSVSQLLFALELLGAAVLVKLLPSLLFAFSGFSVRASLNLGVLLSSRLSLIIVAATIGLESGFITESFKDAVILLAVITCLFGPSAFKWLYRSEEARRVKRPEIRRRKMNAGWMR
jgi:Kef-type K+ transport system membrane component KefB